MANNGKMRFAITTNGPGGEQQINAPAAMPTNSWCHVAVTLDGSQGLLYLDGIPIATNTSLTIRPWQTAWESAQDGIAQTNALGKSKFPGDPLFSGRDQFVPHLWPRVERRGNPEPGLRPPGAGASLQFYKQCLGFHRHGARHAHGQRDHHQQCARVGRQHRHLCESARRPRLRFVGGDAGMLGDFRCERRLGTTG